MKTLKQQLQEDADHLDHELINIDMALEIFKEWLTQKRQEQNRTPEWNYHIQKFVNELLKELTQEGNLNTKRKPQHENTKTTPRRTSYRK